MSKSAKFFEVVRNVWAIGVMVLFFLGAWGMWKFAAWMGQ